ncbi:SDR family oxidoreductase [Leifsonia sp. A12D58]|uniref:SDR family oxidoreductase n=1 Tax=Leifsonia sp. A12D58 TaxID=3397674 RepID=UPI0039E103E5
MSIVVTGATGHLGRLAVESLIQRGVAPADIVAAGRNVERLQEFAGLGVNIAAIDYSDPASLTAAFEGADTLVLVSGSEVGKRVEQHANAINAAKAAGVSRIVYTSAPHADTTSLILAPEHKATEELISASGIPFTILRNGWYTENYAQTVEQAGQSGVIIASVGQGRVASASRADYAEAIAAVLTTPGHENSVYELSGDEAWTHDDLAAAAARILGRDVVYTPLSADEHLATLTAVGLPAETAGFIVALDANIADGLLGETSGDLARLIGHPTTPLEDGLRDALAMPASV